MPRRHKVIWMFSHQELFSIAENLASAAAPPELSAAEEAFGEIERTVADVGRAASGSWLGYQAFVYYADLSPPPPGAHFSGEWGLEDLSFTSLGSRGDWREYDPDDLCKSIWSKAGNPNLTSVQAAANEATKTFNGAKAEISSILQIENADGIDSFLTRLSADLKKLEPLTAFQIAQIWSPKRQIVTRDMIAMGQGSKIPPHLRVKADVAAIRQVFSICFEASAIARKAASHLERKSRRVSQAERIGTNVFIGHGRSLAWRELKDFIQDRLHLPWDEFNRVPVAGVTNQARLAEMLDAANVAFVVMTAEDETAEGIMQARMNVIHEVGLFQGRLGFTKAIILLEDGCEEFSNIQGLGQIRFPKGNIGACFEEVRMVLEREDVLKV